ncbi:hypothetical protein LPJ38_34740 [Bradyrhizobium daqingense]|nr:hypothetical protein [Bradyrhizobium daqingense]UFS88727.1 hypothetical protein LPJ38_34740 [Bradyrhizobium daqingense]
MEWLKARAPGFNQLSKDERNAIADFSLLWAFFESRILNKSGSGAAICAAVDSWDAAGILVPNLVNEELAYFKQRYCPDGRFTHHFDGLHLRPRDRVPMVRGVLSGAEISPRQCLATALIIVFRYRNNLFHGVKWEYALADQLRNFTNANRILMKVLDRYANLP